MMKDNMQFAVFGGGCFWCTEAVFGRLKGILAVKSGYAGGQKENPTYEEVSSGDSGHAEVIQIEYDPKAVSYETLLDVFFSMHDPTTPNQQGADAGTQYRSIILYSTDEQRKSAEAYIKKLTRDRVFKARIVTEIKPLDKFYEAEEYHQKYYRNNPDKSYCRVVIDPKIVKLRERYAHFMK